MRTKSLWFALALALCFLLPGVATAAVTCNTTDFFRDGINMTAAIINPTGVVTGTVNATGCNIGIYYGAGASGVVKNAEIFGANYFGVVVNGDDGDVGVDVIDSRIRNIGEVPLNGSQHGVGIYYRASFLGGTATGRVSGNTITDYQKGGIVVNGVGSQVTVCDNTVTGQGRVDWIAQNGIQIGYGATGSVMRNHVSGNAYTGSWGASSGGIIVVGGPLYGVCPDGNACPYTVNVQITKNILTDNDIGVYLSNWSLTGAPETATNVKVVNNTISNDALTNVSGNGSTGYQAGVSDVGNNDKIINNVISGAGYAAPGNASTYAAAVDAETSFTNRPKVHANK